MNLYREYGTKLLLHHLAALDADVEAGLSGPVAAADPPAPAPVTPAHATRASEAPDRLDAEAA